MGRKHESKENGGKMNKIEFRSKKWNDGVVIVERGKGSKPRERALKNWWRIDRGFPDYPDFTWGYWGEGPVALSYSLVRELFNKETAEAQYSTLLEQFIAKLPQEEGFIITGEEICRILNPK